MPIELHLNTGATIAAEDLPPAEYWIYALHDPREDPEDSEGLLRIAYIGHSGNPVRRFGEHMSAAWLSEFYFGNQRRMGRWPKGPRELWLLHLIELGFYPSLWLLDSAVHENRYKKEAIWRQLYRKRGWYLVNSEGRPYSGIPRRHSPQTLEKISQAQRKRFANPAERDNLRRKNQGRELSPEQYERMLEANRRPEVRARRSAAAKAREERKTPEERSEFSRKMQAKRKSAVAKREQTIREKRERTQKED